jgi:hypothetical protein
VRYDDVAMGREQDELEGDADSSDIRPTPKPPKTLRGWRRWLAITCALFITVGAFASLSSLYLEVRAGRGGDLHRSMWGYKVSPIGILVAVGDSVAVFPAISVIEWLLRRRDRAWERKHPRKPT